MLPDGHASAPTPKDNASSLPDRAGPNEHVKLVVATYYLSEQAEEAVKRYETLHPNVEIELHAVSTSGKDLNEVMNKHDQFVNTNNAAFLAGGGPDVIELDELPSEQYAKRRLLADLNELMEQDSEFRKESYFANIIDHAPRDGDGRLYGMPLYFSLLGMFGDADAIGKAGVTFDDGSWTWSRFIEISRQLKQKGDYPYAFANAPTYLLNELIEENYAQLVDNADGNAVFDTDALSELMRQVQTMSEEELIYGMHLGGRPASVTAEPGSPNGNAYFFEAELYSLQDAVRFAPYPNSKLYAKPRPANAGEGGYFKPFGTLGINANSAHPREAWDFIRFLLDDEGVQSHIDKLLESSPGFPMNRSVYERQKDELLREGSVQQRGSGAIPVDPALLEQVDRGLSTAVHPAGGPSKLSEIVENEATAFFAGQKSANAAANIIGNKINLLLNE